MRKQNTKLRLQRETLRRLHNRNLEPVDGGRIFAANQSIQSGETYCWCTDTCDNCAIAR